VSIHTLAAWQAWKYCSSVESAGTSTLVVTPAGERPIAPGGAEPVVLVLPDGRADDDAVPPPWPRREQLATANEDADEHANKPAATTTVPRNGN
jgi:hypothetical protein